MKIAKRTQFGELYRTMGCTMSLRVVAAILLAGILAGCVYLPPPPEPVYSYVPCPLSPAQPPPGAAAPPPAPPGGATGNQCLAATVPYPPYQYYIVPSYPYASPYYPGAGVSLGFGGVIR